MVYFSMRVRTGETVLTWTFVFSTERRSSDATPTYVMGMLV